MSDIRIETDGFEKASKMLVGVPNGIQTALMRSFNRALTEGRTAAVREATARYTVKAKDVRPTFKMSRAKKADLSAELNSTGKRLPLSLYAHKPTTDTTGARRKQVRVGVMKGAVKPLGQGFMWEGRVMQRLGKTSHPIEQKYGPAVPSILDNDQIVDRVTDKMGESVDKRLSHETIRLLEGNV